MSELYSITAVGSDRTKRTQAMIECFRGLPGEFYMLKGILVAQFAKEPAKRNYNCRMIAKRMDEVDSGK